MTGCFLVFENYISGVVCMETGWAKGWLFCKSYKTLWSN